MNSKNTSKNTILPKDKRVSGGERMAKLASLGETVFHIGDLANLWNIRNKNTLYTTVSRYIARGLIYHIYHGLYSIKKIADVDPRLIGIKALHGAAYISCESVLFDSGIVNQPPKEITLVSKTSKRFTVGGTKFRSRQLRDLFLYNNAGIEIINGIRTASPERAAADILYFSPKKYLDGFASKTINKKILKSIIEKVGY